MKILEDILLLELISRMKNMNSDEINSSAVRNGNNNIGIFKPIGRLIWTLFIFGLILVILTGFIIFLVSHEIIQISVDPQKANHAIERTKKNLKRNGAQTLLYNDERNAAYYPNETQHVNIRNIHSQDRLSRRKYSGRVEYNITHPVQSSDTIHVRSRHSERNQQRIVNIQRVSKPGKMNPGNQVFIQNQ